MAKLKQTDNGVKYVKVDKTEMRKLNNSIATICDSCGEHPLENGYLIPILNSIYCKECFLKWSERTVLYEEDAIYEKAYVRKFSIILDFPLDDSIE